MWTKNYSNLKKERRRGKKAYNILQIKIKNSSNFHTKLTAVAIWKWMCADAPE